MLPHIILNLLIGGIVQDSLENPIHHRNYICIYGKKSTPGIEAAYSWHVRNYNWQILNGLIGNGLISQYPEDYARSIKNLKKDILVPLKADIGIIRKIRSLIVSAAPVLSAKIYVFLRKTYVALHRKQTE